MKKPTPSRFAGPANLDGVGFFIVREPESQNEFAGGKITGAAAEHLRLRFATCGQFDGCADAIAIGFCADQLDAQALVRGRIVLRFIPEQIYRAAVSGEQQVRPAIVVDIGIGGAAPHSGRSERLPERFRDFFEFALADIAEEMRRHGVFHIYLNALDVSIDVAVRYQNVWPAIEIVVEEKASKAESKQGSAADFRARSFVNEEAFAFVVIEREHLVREIRN